jgi:hypothetical protein
MQNGVVSKGKNVYSGRRIQTVAGMVNPLKKEVHLNNI